MEKLKSREPHKLSKVLLLLAECIQENGLYNQLDYGMMNFCLYTKEYANSATVELVCYLDDYPEITDDDVEVHPQFVIQNELEQFCTGETLEMVIGNILHQKSQATIDDFVMGLNYYLERDAFIEL